MSDDCTAVGFSGEGRCIEPATSGPLCDHHAEAERRRLVSLADRIAGKVARVEALTEAATDFDEVGLGWVSVSEIRAALDGFPHEAHPEPVTGNAYADPDRAADDLAPRGTIGVWPPFDGCSHGVSFDDDCAGCDLDEAEARVAGAITPNEIGIYFRGKRAGRGLPNA